MFDAVDEAGRGDHEDLRHETLLVVVVGLVPELVWYRIGTVVEAGGGLGERQRCPSSFGEQVGSRQAAPAKSRSSGSVARPVLSAIMKFPQCEGLTIT